MSAGVRSGADASRRAYVSTVVARSDGSGMGEVGFGMGSSLLERSDPDPLQVERKERLLFLLFQRAPQRYLAQYSWYA